MRKSIKRLMKIKENAISVVTYARIDKQIVSERYQLGFASECPPESVFGRMKKEIGFQEVNQMRENGVFG